MKFELCPTAAPRDPFGQDISVIVDTPASPARTSGFTFAPEDNWIPLSPGSSAADADSFAGLGGGKPPKSAPFEKLTLQPAHRAEGVFDGPAPGGPAMKLSPIPGGDYFEAPGDLAPVPDVSFVKSMPSDTGVQVLSKELIYEHRSFQMWKFSVEVGGRRRTAIHSPAGLVIL